MARVYVSYSEEGPEHQAWVRSVVRRLQRAGHETFYYPDDVVPGDDWLSMMRRWLATADAVVVVATPEYAARAERRSTGVSVEFAWMSAAREAASPGPRVIPLVRRGEFDAALPGWMAFLGAIDARDDRGLLDAMQALERALGADRRGSAPGPSGEAGEGVYLLRLTLTHVKQAASLEIPFTHPDGSPRMWTCILGDNGVGKTTILQGIALAASGAALSGQLAGNARDFVSIGAGDVTAAVACTFTGGMSTRLEVRPGSFQWEGVGQDDLSLDERRRHRLPGFFVAAFGTSRRLSRPGQVAVPSDPVADRVRSVFDGDHRLMGLEFGEALASYGMRDAFLTAMDALIQQAGDEGPVLPGLSGLGRAPDGAPGARGGEIVASLDAGTGAVRLAPHLLSEGYQSVLAWIGELVGHLLLERAIAGLDPLPPAEIGGIVLIDELDLHLHPAWQRRIGPILRRLFPKLQFIITTHAPLVLAGCAPAEVVRLGLHDGAVRVVDGPPADPRWETTSGVLHRWFGVSNAAPPRRKALERKVLRAVASAQSDGQAASAADLSDLEALLAELGE